MRKRYLAAVGATVLLATGGAVAVADSGDPGPATTAKRSHTVTLPTHDTVTLSHDGNVTWHAAPGRAGLGYLTPPALDSSNDLITTKEPTPLDISAVAFDAEGVTAGYADAEKPQKFSLDFQPQEGAEDTKLRKLTFEVSYDDGETWKKVDVKVAGDTATGTLEHPDNTKFVSVRATAVDDAGNKVTHSTIHTHGLK